MASSIYVYSSLYEYTRLYPVGQTIYAETPIFDMYTKPPNKIWIVTQTNVAKERPDLSKSMVHFRNGSANKWLEGDETLVHQDNIRYNYKKSRLEVGKLKFRVDRCIGTIEKPSSKLMQWIKSKVKLDYQFRMYDMERNRINLILSSS